MKRTHDGEALGIYSLVPPQTIGRILTKHYIAQHVKTCLEKSIAGPNVPM